jgi:hypothetical protein
MHVHCLLDEQPDIGRGLGLARQYGEALHHGDEWSID